MRIIIINSEKGDRQFMRCPSLLRKTFSMLLIFKKIVLYYTVSAVKLRFKMETNTIIIADVGFLTAAE